VGAISDHYPAADSDLELSDKNNNEFRKDRPGRATSRMLAHNNIGEAVEADEAATERWAISKAARAGRTKSWQEKTEEARSARMDARVVAPREEAESWKAVSARSARGARG
jgi:hypothetical protein